MYWRYLMIHLLLLWSSISAAWQLEVRDEKIYVSSESAYQSVDVYLAWFDMDAPLDKAISTWSIEQRWQVGVQPVSVEPLNISPFKAIFVDEVPRACVEGHRCFLALLATEPTQSPLEVANWQASMVLPLSPNAAFERLPGQVGFSNNSSRTNYDNINYLDGGDGTLAMDDGAVPAPSAPTEADKSNDATAANSDNTEKPDIFRYIDDKLLYANSAAKRLQIIDLSQPSQPELKINHPLAQQPKEIYGLNNFYVLLQSQWQQQAKQTQIDVFSYDDALASDNSLKQVNSLVLPGLLQQSRRRDDVIYAVLQGNQEAVIYPEISDTKIAVDSDIVSTDWQQMQVQALRLDAFGNLDSVGHATISGYDAKISIFADHLVVTHQRPYDWGSSQIDVFDLSDSSAPLRPLGTIRVPGYVPSEFHVSVRNHYLHVVYQNSDRAQGSHLAIYDLANTQLPLVGEVGGIAPGERLYATRFNADYAYVVTFLQTDPLWVIDLANPEAPKIVGELKVPGWSEKMFFNDGRLFAIGYDDRAGREVSLSLFDVQDPTNPQVLDRFTPESNSDRTYTYSPAIDDERALLLNWSRAFAAVPINNHNDANRLHLVNFDLDMFVNRGNVVLPETANRSFIIDETHLGVLGNDNFYTVAWGTDTKPSLEATLPLARRLDQVLMQNTQPWGVSFNAKGTQQALHALNPDQSEDNLHLNGKQFDLPSLQYANRMDMNADYVAISQNYPFSLQMLDLHTGLVSDALVLDNINYSAHSWLNENVWYQSYAYHHNPYAEPELAIKTADVLPQSKSLLYEDKYQNQWILRTFSNDAGKIKALNTYITPGAVIGQNSQGEFISFETNRLGQLRLNRLAAVSTGLRLLQTQDLACQQQTPLYADDVLYVRCENTQGQYDLVQIDARNLSVLQTFALPENYQASRVNEDVLFLRPNYNYYYPYPVDDIAIEPAMMSRTDIAANSMIAPDYNYVERPCLLVKMTPDNLETLHQFDTCPGEQQLGFNASSAYVARGYEPVEIIRY